MKKSTLPKSREASHSENRIAFSGVNSREQTSHIFTNQVAVSDSRGDNNMDTLTVNGRSEQPGATSTARLGVAA